MKKNIYSILLLYQTVQLKQSCHFFHNSKSSVHPSSCCFSLDWTSFSLPSNFFTSDLESSNRLTKCLSCCIWALYSPFLIQMPFVGLQTPSLGLQIASFFFIRATLLGPWISSSLESKLKSEGSQIKKKQFEDQVKEFEGQKKAFESERGEYKAQMQQLKRFVWWMKDSKSEEKQFDGWGKEVKSKEKQLKGCVEDFE